MKNRWKVSMKYCKITLNWYDGYKMILFGKDAIYAQECSIHFSIYFEYITGEKIHLRTEL